jgi:hypothetical protein
MPEVRDRKFDAEFPVQTDGGHFIGCTFEGTTLAYGGGEHPKFDQCTLDGVNWYFTGEALRTIQFLQQINASPGGPAFLGDLFRPGAYLSE